MPELKELELYKESVTEYPHSVAGISKNAVPRYRWYQCDFTKADLGLKDLSGDFFQECDFDGVTFEKSTLKGATFIKCSFVGTTFKDCDLRWCNFSSCDLEGSKAVDCRTVLIQLQYCNESLSIHNY